jgi:hypothetical protein
LALTLPKPQFLQDKTRKKRMRSQRIKKPEKNRISGVIELQDGD